MTVNDAYSLLFTICITVIGACIICSILRSILGPRVTDRMVAVNMVGTQVISVIATLSIFLKEAYLADICLIYVLISFVSVTILTKVYISSNSKDGKNND